MRVLYADDSPPQGRAFYKVIQLHGRWYVAACGGFYQVDSRLTCPILVNMESVVNIQYLHLHP